MSGPPTLAPLGWCRMPALRDYEFTVQLVVTVSEISDANRHPEAFTVIGRARGSNYDVKSTFKLDQVYEAAVNEAISRATGHVAAICQNEQGR